MALKTSRTKRLPYAYRPGDTPLHHLGGGVKLAALLLISAAPSLFGAKGLACAGCLALIGSLAAKIPPWELLRGFKALVPLMVLLTLARSLDLSPLAFKEEGFLDALRFGGSLLLSFASGALLFAVTPMRALRESLGKLETLLRHPLAALGKPKEKNETPKEPFISLGIALLLSFLPRFFEVWEDSQRAYLARGGKRGFAELVTLVPQTTERMILKAAEIAAAMESRGV